MITNFKDSNGIDLGDKFVPKSYLIDRYPDLVDSMRFAGVWTWGLNEYGSLGNGNANQVLTPTKIASDITWKTIAAGGSYVAAIKTNGDLWLWGFNSYGQLGDSTTIDKSSPIQLGTNINWKIISCRSGRVAGITNVYTLWLWGRNDYGQLGDNTIVNKSSPVQTIASGTTWIIVSCGTLHTGAIKTDNSLWVWGRAIHGQLGLNNLIHRSSPIQLGISTDWKSISFNGDHSAAIKTDGTLWTWGRNDIGQLGHGDTIYRSSPTQIGSATTWRFISTGSFFSSAIKTDGTLWLWGRNDYGQLGDGTTINKSSPVQTIAGGTTWHYCNHAAHTGLAIKTDGTLWTWGSNDGGQLGNNTTSNTSSPIQTISQGSNWKSVCGGTRFTVAIRDEYEDLI